MAPTKAFRKWLGLWGNHEMRGSWIGTLYVVIPQNGSKDFQKSSFLASLHHNFYFFKENPKNMHWIFPLKSNHWQHGNKFSVIILLLQNHEIAGITNSEIKKFGDPVLSISLLESHNSLLGNSKNYSFLYFFFFVCPCCSK